MKTKQVPGILAPQLIISYVIATCHSASVLAVQERVSHDMSSAVGNSWLVFETGIVSNIRRIIYPDEFHEVDIRVYLVNFRSNSLVRESTRRMLVISEKHLGNFTNKSVGELEIIGIWNA